MFGVWHSEDSLERLTELNAPAVIMEKERKLLARRKKHLDELRRKGRDSGYTLSTEFEWDESRDIMNRLSKGEKGAAYDHYLLQAKQFMAAHGRLKNPRPKITRLLLAKKLIIMALEENTTGQEAHNLLQKIGSALQRYKKVFPIIVQEQIKKHGIQKT